MACPRHSGRPPCSKSTTTSSLNIQMNMSTHTHITAPIQFVEAGGIRFAHRKFRRNSRPPLLKLGHFPAPMENWDPDLTDGLGKSRPIILFSNAGIGLTTGTTPNTVAEMARDAIRFIEALELKQVDLLGFSLGGFIDVQITLDRPDLVRRLVLAGTGPEGGQDMQTYIPEVQKVATNENPVMEDFLYLFFTPSESSQKAGRSFWERRHRRKADVEPASSMEVMLAQAEGREHGESPIPPRFRAYTKLHNPYLSPMGTTILWFQPSIPISCSSISLVAD